MPNKAIGQFALGAVTKLAMSNPEWCMVPKKDWLERNRALNSLWFPVVTFTIPMVFAFLFEWYRTPESDWNMRSATFIGGALFGLLTFVFGFFFQVDVGKRRAALNSTATQELTDWSIATVVIPPGKRVELMDIEPESATSTPSAS